MIEPLRKDDAFLDEVRGASGGPDEFRLWWLGQSGFLVRWQDDYLLLDPYLSDSLTKKYAQTDKPHVRMTARVVAPERLDFVGVVTSSHGHTDHLDPETLRPLFQANPRACLVMPEAIRDTAGDRSGLEPERLLGIDAGQSITVGSFKLSAVPAAHERVEKDSAGRHLFLGFVVEFGPFRLFHSGDTVRFDGMVEWLRPWRVSVALLPINGRHPSRRVAGNLDGREAATLAREINAQIAIPCHYEMFEFNTATPDEFVRTAEELGQGYRLLRAGEGSCVHKLS